jgi:hypothetical protein
MMTVDDFVQYLHSCRSTHHVLSEPAREDDISALEQQLGPLPAPLRHWLSHHNGSKLFIRSGALLTLFGLSDADGFAPSYGWSIHTFTQHWRQVMNRPAEWVFGIRNDGRLLLLDSTENVKEWDTNLKKWSGNPMPLSDWLAIVSQEGQEYLAP